MLRNRHYIKHCRKILYFNYDITIVAHNYVSLCFRNSLNAVRGVGSTMHQINLEHILFFNYDKSVAKGRAHGCEKRNTNSIN